MGDCICVSVPTVRRLRFNYFAMTTFFCIVDDSYAYNSSYITRAIISVAENKKMLACMRVLFLLQFILHSSLSGTGYNMLHFHISIYRIGIRKFLLFCDLAEWVYSVHMCMCKYCVNFTQFLMNQTTCFLICI